MPYNSAKYEFLFDLSGENTERAFDRFRHRNVFRYRTRTIKAGNVLEVEIFPIWNTQNEVREAKKHTTREAQKNLNDKNAKKKFIRKINANFTEEDLGFVHQYGRTNMPARPWFTRSHQKATPEVQAAMRQAWEDEQE